MKNKMFRSIIVLTLLVIWIIPLLALFNGDMIHGPVQTLSAMKDKVK